MRGAFASAAGAPAGLEVNRGRSGFGDTCTVPDAPFARAWRRIRATPVPYVAIGVVYVVVRLVVVLSVRRTFGDFPDSSTYRQAATGPVYSYLSFAGNAMRPFTVPLLYTAMPNDGARVAAQVVISVAGWLTLAGVVASVLRSFPVRVAGFVVVLLFGSTYLVTTWDLAIASESLTISLGVLAVAAWLRFGTRPTAWSSAAVVVTTTLWMFTRAQAFPLVLLLALCAAAWSIRGEGRRRKLVVAGLLTLVAVWGFSSVKNQEHFYAARDGQGVGIFSETFALNLRFRILPDAAATAWFREQGMPDPTGLEGHRRATLAEDDWAGWPAFFDRYRANAELTTWVDDHGQATLTRYVLQHPAKIARQFGGDLPDVLVPDRASVAYVDSPAVLGPLDAVFTPYAGQGVPGVPVAVLVVACLAMAIVVAARAPRRRAVSWSIITLAAGLLVISVAGIFLGWLGSPVEFARHALPFTLFVPIALALVLLALVDAAWRPLADAVDDEVADGPTVPDLTRLEPQTT